MSRPQVKSNGLKLPHTLQKELGLELRSPSSFGGRRTNGPAGSRKAKRKAERIGKKAERAGLKQKNGPIFEKQLENEEASSENDDQDDHIAAQPNSSFRTTPATRQLVQQKPKSILKKPPSQNPSTQVEEPSSNRASSPGLVLDSSSRAFKDREAEDDAEILALEKKLGLKNKKITKSFVDDGLGDILEGLDSGDEGKKRKREGDDWLEKKRQKSITQRSSGMVDSDEDDLSRSEEEDILSEEDETDNEDEDISDLDEDSDEMREDYSDFAGFDSDQIEEPSAPKQARENPYVAPVLSSGSIAKYVPPSLRARTVADTESLERLQRQIQGHLNKLSEANLLSILSEIEKLYQSNARQEVTSTLLDLLLSLFCDRSQLQSTFVILHAAFIAAVYKVIGTDFGAVVLSKLVERLDKYYADQSVTTGKEAANLVGLLSHLFSFHVVNSTILFDYLRLFLQELSEANTELLLKVLRECGPQLRQDDPSSLKTMVQIMQNSAAKLAADGVEMSVRTKFMIETITDLKNNKMKSGKNSSGVASEHITQMRKLLGSLNSRSLKATDPLRTSRDDINNSDQKGKWWLVGASWKGDERLMAKLKSEPIQVENTEIELDSGDSDLLALARQYRMNTDVRRSIFVAIMSAADFQDAHIRLMKLRLKRSQEREIPKVLLRCVAAEAVYNPYYTLIAKKSSSEKKMKMAFQFVLWDFFRRMGEKGDEESDDEDEPETVELTEIVNVAKMYASLIADGSLTIGVIKTLNLAYLKDRAKMFVEVLLVVIITQMTQAGKRKEQDNNALVKVFNRAAETPQVIKGLQYFIKKHIRHSDLVGKKDQLHIKHGCKVALETLDLISMSNITSG